MKKLFILPLFLTHIISSQAQEIKVVKNKCPEPGFRMINQLCGCIIINEQVEGDDQNYYAYAFEKRMLEMSCADLRQDSEEEAKVKINRMWNKYRNLFTCGTQVNILKYALDESYTSFVGSLASDYGLDINFIDPYDKKNLYDYINDKYVESLQFDGELHPRTKLLKGYMDLIKAVGGKPSK